MTEEEFKTEHRKALDILVSCNKNLEKLAGKPIAEILDILSESGKIDNSDPRLFAFWLRAREQVLEKLVILNEVEITDC